MCFPLNMDNMSKFFWLLVLFERNKSVDLVEEREKEMVKKFLSHHWEKGKENFFHSVPTRSLNWIWLGGKHKEARDLKQRVFGEKIILVLG